MSEYYGSEGFDRPPSDVYSVSYGGGYFGDDGAAWGVARLRSGSNSACDAAAASASCFSWP